MPKYIDADALEVVGFTDRQGSFSDGVQWLLEYIDKLPSADVQPVRHGRWETDGMPMDDGEYLMTRCTVCGTAYEYGHNENYCGYCGAKNGRGDMMAKYISVGDLRAATTKCNKIWNTITDASGRGLDEIIDSLPSADVQPVGRCKDCKHSTEWYRDKRRCFLWCEDGIDVFEDGFCNYWDRKDGEPT